MKIVLLLLSALCLLLPITGVVLAALFGVLNFGVVLAAGAFIAVFFYPFLRMTLWQIYGAETFFMYRNKIIYEAYFKFLKYEVQEIEIFNPDILFSDRELKNDERIGSLVFLVGENKLKSVLKISEADYEQIVRRSAFIYCANSPE